MKLHLVALILFFASLQLSCQNPLPVDPLKEAKEIRKENVTLTSESSQTINEANKSQTEASNSSQASARQLNKQSAPYTISDSTSQLPVGDVRKLIFRLLTINETLATVSEDGNGQGRLPEWTLSSLGLKSSASDDTSELKLSSSNLNERASVELKNLLGKLSQNNFTTHNSATGDISLDNGAPIGLGLANITISEFENLTSAQVNDQLGDANRFFLAELLSEVNPALLMAHTNMSSVIKDNHRFIGRHPIRSKPLATLNGGSILDNSLLVPPIRRTVDVIAENYTARKIADEANNFAFKLVNQLNLERLGNENIIHSPFTIYQGLALLLLGAMGDTSRELDRVLLTTQSVYENTKLTHDQDRARLMASFGDVVRQLQQSSTNHFRYNVGKLVPSSSTTSGSMNCTFVDSEETDDEGEISINDVGSTTYENMGTQFTQLDCNFRPSNGLMSQSKFSGGSEEQHFIVANNLLFSSNSFEISQEFKQTLNSFFNNTALTKMEVGSTESIQVINSWIRHATNGLIPAILKKRSTFDEFNVMTLLSTSWLAQEWLSSFQRVASPLRSSIRLKGQLQAQINRNGGSGGRFGRQTFGKRPDEPLMEFVDDHKNSHFVEYIRSEPTRQIHNYHTVMNKQWVDVVVVPFSESNQRMIIITPLQQSAQSTSGRANSIQLNTGADIVASLSSSALKVAMPAAVGAKALNMTEPDPLAALLPADQQPLPIVSDPSPLTKMIGAFAFDPRRAIRSLWATIAPDLITKQTIQSLQLAKQKTTGQTTFQVNSNSTISRNLHIPPKTRLSMPIIRIDADSTVTAALNHIGLVNTFDPAQANFIGINGHPFNYNKLHLSNVIYKTTFNLNENGINYDRTVKTLESMRVASAANSKKRKYRPKEQELERGELINEVKLDKPFMFLIADIKTKLILYTGVVRNPAKESSS